MKVSRCRLRPTNEVSGYWTIILTIARGSSKEGSGTGVVTDVTPGGKRTIWKKLKDLVNCNKSSEKEEKLKDQGVKNGEDQGDHSVMELTGIPEEASPMEEEVLLTLMEDMEDFDWVGAYEKDICFKRKFRRASETGKEVDGYKLKGQILRYRSTKGWKLCIPEALLPDVLNLAHDALGHFGYKKTFDRISNSYYRPGLGAIVEEYVANCPKCMINKTTRSRKSGNLLPIDVPGDNGIFHEAFDCVAMDFIVQLLLANGFDAILVVIDKFTCYGIFLPCTSNFTARSIAELFFSGVVSCGWLPRKFVTDRDSRFLSEFWKHLKESLEVVHKTSTAYHAQTDGATERLNQTLEISLRAYVSTLQDNWNKWLPLMELSYNSAKNVSTKESPFSLLYIQPHNVIRRILEPSAAARNESVEDWLDIARLRITDTQECMKYAAGIQKRYYDMQHLDIPPYKEGDYVSLRLDRHPTSIRHNKLSLQKLPPYEVTKVLSGGRALQLAFPEQLKGIHNVVSSQQVEKALNPALDPYDRKHAQPPALDAEQTQWEAEIIGDQTTRGGKKKYKVMWIGYPLDEAQWLNENDVGDDLISAYEERERRRRRAATTSAIDTMTATAWCRATLGNLAPSPASITEINIVTSDPSAPFEYKLGIPRDGKSMEQPVLYISRNTKDFERNYESTERELACLVWAFIKTRHLLEGSETFVITDHASIREILQSSASTQYSFRIDKFRMLLAPFIDWISVTYKPGKEMVNVDPLSRASYTFGHGVDTSSV